MRIPGYLCAMLAIYCVASLIHFAHNAEFICEYPNLPVWLTPLRVYLAWLAVTAVGITGILFVELGFRLPGLVLIAGYAALGFAGLDHYSLAPASAHTLAMNATIGFEVAAAAVVLATAAAQLLRLQHGRDALAYRRDDSQAPGSGGGMKQPDASIESARVKHRGPA